MNTYYDDSQVPSHSHLWPISQVTVPREKRNDKTVLGLLNVGAELTFISGDSVSQRHFVVGAYVSLMTNLRIKPCLKFSSLCPRTHQWLFSQSLSALLKFIDLATKVPFTLGDWSLE